MKPLTLVSTLLYSTSAAVASSSSGEDDSTRFQIAPIYIQPIYSSGSTATTPPTLLAEISIPPPPPSSSSPSDPRPQVVSYEAPDLSSSDNDNDDDEDGSAGAGAGAGVDLARIGIYDPKTERWVSSTSVVSTRNFGKGYSPNFILTLAASSSSSSQQSKQQSSGNNNKSKGEEEMAVVVGVTVRGVKIDAGYTRDFGPQVVVLRTEEGKEPQLNRPVVLNADGRRVGPGEGQQEKSFVQKYWWALAIGAVLMLGGGGDGK